MTSSQPLKPKDRLQLTLTRALPAITKVLPKHLTAEKVATVAMLAANRQPLLCTCYPPTVIAAVMNASEMGLELGPGWGHAYLVPYRNTKKQRYDCQLQVGYQGWVEVMLRSKKVIDVAGIAVFEGDDWAYEEGSKPFVRHIPNLDAERSAAKLVRVYARALLPDGVSTKVEVMTRAEVDARRARSQSPNQGPWATDFIAMARKCPIKTMAKFAAKSPEIATAVQVEESGEGAYEDPTLTAVEEALGGEVEEMLGEAEAAAAQRPEEPDGQQDLQDDRRLAEEEGAR